MICAACEHTAVAADKAKIGRCISRSTGSIGGRSPSCRRTKITPMTKLPPSSSTTSGSRSPWPIPSNPVMNSPSVIAFITALVTSNSCDVSGERGRNRMDISSDTTPNGSCSANSHGQDPTARIAAATDGPAADDVATTSTL